MQIVSEYIKKDNTSRENEELYNSKKFTFQQPVFEPTNIYLNTDLEELLNSATDARMFLLEVKNNQYM